MTHSLHRVPVAQGEYVVLVMACQGVSDEGAQDALRCAYDILVAHDPVNLSDGENSVFSGATQTQLREAIRDTSYLAAVYHRPDAAILVLRALAEADTGMSVVLAGDPGALEPVMRRAGVDAHTVHLSLGAFGVSPGFADHDVKAIALMCGHGLITPPYVETVREEVRRGRMSARAGANRLAALCTCGIFNIEVAANLLGNGVCSCHDPAR